MLDKILRDGWAIKMTWYPLCDRYRPLGFTISWNAAGCLMFQAMTF